MSDRSAVRIAALLLALTLASCGPAGPTSRPSASSPGSAMTPAAPTTPVAASPSADTTEEPGSAGTAGCEVAELKASHGIVDAAAGSRITEVVLVSAETCSVDAFPALGLRDATGSGLLDASSAGPGAIDLVPGVAYTSQVRLANWCGPEPEFPLSLELVVGGIAVPITGASFPDDGDVPPCVADGGPILDGSAWTPTP